MNWYSKLIKLGFRNDLDMDAVEICRKIFFDIRMDLSSNHWANKIVKYDINEILKESKRKSKEKYINAEVFINVSLEFYDTLPSPFGFFDVSGLTLDYGLKKQDVEFFVRIVKNIKKDSFQQLYMMMFNVIRHEIQHVLDNLLKTTEPVQLQNSNKSDAFSGHLAKKISKISEEILSEKEIIPYIKGFMLRAKREHCSFIEIVKEFIDISFYGSSQNKNILSNYPIYSEIKTIEDLAVNKIIEKAKEIYNEVF